MSCVLTTFNKDDDDVFDLLSFVSVLVHQGQIPKDAKVAFWSTAL